MTNQRTLTLVLALTLPLFALACSPYYGPQPVPRYGPEVRIEVFYDALSPYGEWILLDAYGWVWIPAGVSVTWRPYTYGHWAYTDFGWTWSSHWVWGWAPFHYGRWFHHGRRGWIWIPDRHWAPAWVSWRVGGGRFGWAPLPHNVHWSARFGLELGGVGLDVAISSDHWVFVADRHLLDHDLRARIDPPMNNTSFLTTTHDATGYRSQGPWAAEHGLSAQRVEQVLGRAIPVHRIEALDRPPTNLSGKIDREVLRIYRPQVKEAPPARTPPRRGKGKGKG